MTDGWAPLDLAIARAEQDGRIIQIWLRDDDAVAPTRALEQLATLARRFALPVLLAVIPEPTTAELAAFLTGEPLLEPTQHGLAHRNHARTGERAREVGGDRPLRAVLDDLARGRARMDALFGSRHAGVLVPPWNRIDAEVLPHLPDLEFRALSTFGDAHRDAMVLPIVNCDLDIIDWRGGRRAHPDDKLVRKLAALIDTRSSVGILTHHLVHDEPAWRFLDRALERLAASPAIRLTSWDRLSR